MNNTIIEINRKILASLNDNSSIGLAHGRMGICVYLFLQSKRNGYSSCKQDAEQLLDDIYTTLDFNVSKDIESGLAGIALGIRLNDDEMKMILGGSSSSCSSGFLCTCNGKNYGCVSSVEQCWSKC